MTIWVKVTPSPDERETRHTARFLKDTLGMVDSVSEGVRLIKQGAVSFTLPKIYEEVLCHQ
jgi:hypothetical protein